MKANPSELLSCDGPYIPLNALIALLCPTEHNHPLFSPLLGHWGFSRQYFFLTSDLVANKRIFYYQPRTCLCIWNAKYHLIFNGLQDCPVPSTWFPICLLILHYFVSLTKVISILCNWGTLFLFHFLYKNLKYVLGYLGYFTNDLSF